MAEFIMKLQILLIVALLSLLLTAQFGAVEIDLWQLVQCGWRQCENLAIEQQIFWQIRLPRILVGFAVGGGLALVGCILQSVTRNPLADPYLFGIVSGAGLGAVAGESLAAIWGVVIPLSLSAFVGAFMAVFAVVALNFYQGWRRVEQVLLAGVAISFLCTAITGFLLYLQSPYAASRIMFWLMGSLAQTDWQAVKFILPLVLVGLVAVLALARKLDALVLSDDAVHSLGISVVQIRLFLMILVAAISAVIVAFCGGIGFVGLMMPHLIKRFVGNKHSILAWASILAGGSFLLWVDVFARSILPNQEIPLGIITAAIGSIFFIGLMFKKF